MFRPATITSLALVALASGCSDDRTVQEPKTPFAYTVTVYDDTETVYDDTETPYDEVQRVAGIDDVTIEDKIAQICEIPTPHFAFDSAKLRDGVEPSLDELAHCLSEGALKGAAIVLIGHTDPRGTEEYNLELGQMRSAAVAQYLIAKGVDDANIIVTSRGERAADGAGPGEWQDDRRVQITLRK